MSQERLEKILAKANELGITEEVLRGKIEDIHRSRLTSGDIEDSISLTQLYGIGPSTITIQDAFNLYLNDITKKDLPQVEKLLKAYPDVGPREEDVQTFYQKGFGAFKWHIDASNPDIRALQDMIWVKKQTKIKPNLPEQEVKEYHKKLLGKKGKWLNHTARFAEFTEIEPDEDDLLLGLI